MIRYNILIKVVLMFLEYLIIIQMSSNSNLMSAGAEPFYKILLVGDSKVGKTTFVKHCLTSKFSKIYNRSIMDI